MSYALLGGNTVVPTYSFNNNNLIKKIKLSDTFLYSSGSGFILIILDITEARFARAM